MDKQKIQELLDRLQADLDALKKELGYDNGTWASDTPPPDVPPSGSPD